MFSEPLLFWCISSCLFTLGGLVMLFALLKNDNNRKIGKNKRYQELVWQSRSRDTDWWLEIGRDRYPENFDNQNR